MNIIRKGISSVCKENKYRYGNDADVVYLTFPGLESTGIIKQCFTTRLGGASSGEFASMNLSYTRGDKVEAVDENYRRIAKVMDSKVEDIVCSQQTHTTNVEKVTQKGVKYQEVDGLITNVPGIVLSTFYADCVPLYIVDPVNKAIGLSHSGWRGTVNKMGEATLRAMKEAYGTNPAQVKVAIGPSICQDCYEVSEEVALEFAKAFSNDAEKAKAFLMLYKNEQDILDSDIENCLCYRKENGKYQLNLWYANYRVFVDAGVRPDNIEVTDICTCCNPDVLFSHRASQGKRGNLGAFLCLK